MQGLEDTTLAIYLPFHIARGVMRIILSIFRFATVVLLSWSASLYGQKVASAVQPDSAHRSGNTLSTASNTVPDTSAITSQFVLGAADVIRIYVWKNTDLSQTVTIGPDGFVSMPLLGDVHVAGMTANQLAQELKSKLSSYMVNAQVTVSIVEIRSRQVYVTGQVGKPGGYPLITPISVLQVIAQAGGLSTFANRKDIVILRSSGGQVQRLKFNYNNAVRGDPTQNISLQPGDTVIVP
jgi:polysaccharide export outer membrane protein